LVNGARMPQSGELPESLRALADRHAAVLRGDPDYRSDVARLVEALRRHLKTGRLNLQSLGGAAQATANAAGIPAGVIAAWLLATGSILATAVPQVREPVVHAGSEFVERITSASRSSSATNTSEEKISAEPPVVSLCAGVETAWRDVKTSTDTAEVRRFLSTSPRECETTNQALAHLESLERTQNEAAAREAQREHDRKVEAERNRQAQIERERLAEVERQRQTELERQRIAQVARQTMMAEESAAYNRALQSRSRTAYQNFLNSYSNSTFAVDVRRRLNTCRMQQQTQRTIAEYTAGEVAESSVLSGLSDQCYRKVERNCRSNGGTPIGTPRIVDSCTPSRCNVWIYECTVTCRGPRDTVANVEVCE